MVVNVKIATFYISPRYDLSNGMVQDKQLTPALILSSSKLVGEDGKLGNHLRERGPYISKLLNEAYNNI